MCEGLYRKYAARRQWPTSANGTIVGAPFYFAIFYFAIGDVLLATHCHWPPGILIQVSVQRSFTLNALPSPVPLPLIRSGCDGRVSIRDDLHVGVHGAGPAWSSCTPPRSRTCR